MAILLLHGGADQPGFISNVYTLCTAPLGRTAHVLTAGLRHTLQPHLASLHVDRDRRFHPRQTHPTCESNFWDATLALLRQIIHGCSRELAVELKAENKEPFGRAMKPSRLVPIKADAFTQFSSGCHLTTRVTLPTRHGYLVASFKRPAARSDPD